MLPNTVHPLYGAGTVGLKQGPPLKFPIGQVFSTSLVELSLNIASRYM